MIVTAKKYLDYKRANGYLEEEDIPKVVLICYQDSAIEHLLSQIGSYKKSCALNGLYVAENIGILRGAVGGPALMIQLEKLAVFGVQKFLAIGLAGAMNDYATGDYVISPQALAEDGVSCHYLREGELFAEANRDLMERWEIFHKEERLPLFHKTSAWSFSAIFKESAEHIRRVKSLGCGVVEMECAALYAFAKEKNLEALSLFVVSDLVSETNWHPCLKEQHVRNNLHQLALWMLQFCEKESSLFTLTKTF